MPTNAPHATTDPESGMQYTYISNYLSPLGPLLLASDGTALTGLWFEDQRHLPPMKMLEKARPDSLPLFDATFEWLDRYFAGRDPGATPPLRPAGSPFQQAVWALLREIPYGKRTTYGILARELAGRQNRSTWSAQAVGGAVGRNPISILIPCHRVVGHNGSLTGYAGGIERKCRLLRLETDHSISGIIDDAGIPMVKFPRDV